MKITAYFKLLYQSLLHTFFETDNNLVGNDHEMYQPPTCCNIFAIFFRDFVEGATFALHLISLSHLALSFYRGSLTVLTLKKIKFL